MHPSRHVGRVAAIALAIGFAGFAAACQPINQTGDSSTTTTTAKTTATTVAGPKADSGFLAFGDAGWTDPSVQQQVADQMRTWVAAGHRADALVEAGDAVYDVGAPARFTAALTTPYGGLPTPLWVALGNHDVLSGNAGADQLTYLGLPSLPYAKTLPGVQLLFLDANHPDAAQALWLDARLSEAGPALRVVVFHQPAYSCATHGSTPAVDSVWVPILEAHRVALVINGHDHYYERFLSTNDVTYVVTGGGGAPTYARQPTCTGVPPSQATAVRHHFVSVEVTGSSLRLTVVARTGEVLDTATITR